MSGRQTTPSVLDSVLGAPAPTLTWDYLQIEDEPTRKRVKSAAVQIKSHGQRMRESVFMVGQRLIEVKAALPHGQFGDWIETEFGMSDVMAQNLMRVAREFGDKSETVSFLTDSAMYLLAGPSVPEAARDEVIAVSQERQASPTKREVKRVIERHKEGRGARGGASLSVPTLKPPPPAEEIRGCLDSLAWEAAPVSDERRIAHMMEPTNFMYYVRGVQDRTGFPVNQRAISTYLLEMIRYYRDREPLPQAVDEVDEMDGSGQVIDVQPSAPSGRPSSDARAEKLRDWLDAFQHVLDGMRSWGDLTGRHSATGEAERGLRTLLAITERELALLNGESVAEGGSWGEGEV